METICNVCSYIFLKKEILKKTRLWISSADYQNYETVPALLCKRECATHLITLYKL